MNASSVNAPLGTLVVGNATALGGGPLALTSGNFQVGGAFAIPAAINASLNGAASSLVVFNGTNPIVFNGAIALANALTIQATQPTTLNGVVSGADSLALESGSLELTARNTYTGATTVNGATIGTTFTPGTLKLSAANGIIVSATTMNMGGTVLLDNTAANNNARLNVATTFNGGTLTILGNDTVTNTESIGAITLGVGTSTLNLTKGQEGNLVLSGTTPTRANGSGGVISFGDGNTGTLGSAVRATFSSALTLTGTDQPGGTGLIPYATVKGADFATYSGGSIVPYSGTGAAYAASVSGAAIGANVNLAANDTVTTSKTINALMVSGNVTLTINPGQSLTVASGALFVNGEFTLTVTGGGTLNLGEAIINTASGPTVTVNRGDWRQLDRAPG